MVGNYVTGTFYMYKFIPYFNQTVLICKMVVNMYENIIPSPSKSGYIHTYIVCYNMAIFIKEKAIHKKCSGHLQQFLSHCKCTCAKL